MFPPSGPGAPQQQATSPQQPSPWAPPGQQGFAPPQQQGFKPQQGFAPQQPPQQNPYAPPQQNPYAPPQHGQQPNPYAPPGATPHGAYPAHGQPQHGHPPHGQPQHGHPQHGQPPHGQPPYSPHAPTPPPVGAVPAPGKKSSKGLLIGLAVAGVAIAGGIVAFVMLRGGGDPKGGDSRDAVIKGTLAALADGNVDRLLALADPVGLHDKLVDCSGKTKPRKKEGRDDDDDDEDKDDDKDISDEEKERRDPKKQREKMKEEFEKIAPRAKGAKIELVEIVTKEPPVPSDDEKKKKDDDDEDYDKDKELTFLMKSGERVYTGCYSKKPARLAETKIKVKVTPPKGEAIEQEAKVMMIQVGKGWYLLNPPRISAGGAALAKEFSEMRDKVCACKDAACADKLKDEIKEDRGKEFKKEMKDLSDKEKDKIDAIEEEIKVCEKKLAGEAQLVAMTQFKDKMCACADKSCADKVMQEMSVWSRSQDSDKLPDDIMKKASAIGQEMAACMQKLYSSNTGGGIGSTIAEAGSVSAGGMPAACIEYKNFIGKLATCSKFPESSRKSLEDGFRAMEDGWKNIDWTKMPADSKKQVNDGCQQGLDAMKQSATAMGC